MHSQEIIVAKQKELFDRYQEITGACFTATGVAVNKSLVATLEVPSNLYELDTDTASGDTVSLKLDSSGTGVLAVFDGIGGRGSFGVLSAYYNKRLVEEWVGQRLEQSSSLCFSDKTEADSFLTELLSELSVGDPRQRLTTASILLLWSHSVTGEMHYSSVNFGDSGVSHHHRDSYEMVTDSDCVLRDYFEKNIINLYTESASVADLSRKLVNQIGEDQMVEIHGNNLPTSCLLYTSPSPRDQRGSRMPSSA